ncbi:MULTISPECIES: FtsB family cell division protein [Halocynthiibacter]|uniref:Septum formation initiator family protein n=1 Tax=Halocynthiibacter halioticoli TaxID=2986804 RepID=A0AAE3J055_9RHOB|nr:MULTISPECIES: septum formation initiator family protein [Halocynthiibacter]MCV6824106.1 septum formation initiator family protein [Halocynthiibacter halioticoli]MCW4057107.1 septum formation initiator family protein [Halocynthiibacter sp. SDUM655004]
MSQPKRKSLLGVWAYSIGATGLAVYFTFAAVQGDYGIFNRVQITAEAEALKAELAEISRQVAVMENKTRRLSDSYLDLDLLDEQARSVLGLIRSDEIVVR